jgi:hypothetical protein
MKLREVLGLGALSTLLLIVGAGAAHANLLRIGLCRRHRRTTRIRRHRGGVDRAQSFARGPGSFSGGEAANLYVHDGGAATVQLE